MDRNRYVIVAQDAATMVEGMREATLVANALHKRTRSIVYIYSAKKVANLILIEEVGGK